MISVILPVYNVKDYIEQCIESLISQTYGDIEILLVDDGSTDGTGAVCDRLAETDSRIRVFHKENGGASTARNLGLQKATGQYVMFMDPDDWLDTDTFATLVPLIELHRPDVIRFSYIREFGHTSVIKKNTFVKEGLSEGKDFRKVYRQTLGLVGEELAHPENMNFLASVCFSLYNKEVIDKNGLQFYDVRKIATFSDGLFNLCVLGKAASFYYIDRPFYHYRKFAAGAATSNYRENFLEKQRLLFGMLKKIADDEQDSQFLEAYNNRVVFSTLELCLNVFKKSKKKIKKYRQIKQILKNPEHRDANKALKTTCLPITWRCYFILVKIGLVWPVYLMTKVIRFIQRKG